jgi:hypothetical protein
MDASALQFLAKMTTGVGDDEHRTHRAATLQQLGIRRATDLDGGFRA